MTKSTSSSAKTKPLRAWPRPSSANGSSKRQKDDVEAWKVGQVTRRKSQKGRTQRSRADPDGSSFLLALIKDGQVVTGTRKEDFRRNIEFTSKTVLISQRERPVNDGLALRKYLSHEPNLLNRSVASHPSNQSRHHPELSLPIHANASFILEVELKSGSSFKNVPQAIGDIEVQFQAPSWKHSIHRNGLFRSKITNNQRSIVRLEAKRDTLLPKLMSGEVRVQMD